MKLMRALVVAVVLSGLAFVGCVKSTTQDTPETGATADAADTKAAEDAAEPVDVTPADDMAGTVEIDATSDAGSSDSALGAEVQTGTTVRPWIDTHAHPTGIHNECGDAACLDTVIAIMDAHGLKKAILMHPPAGWNGLDEASEALVREVVEMRPDRFFLGAGGNVLNARIQKAGDSEQEATDMEAVFIATANELVAGGGVVVFGETTSCHLSYEDAHPFEQVPTDSKLYRTLVDLAATHDVAVDIHIDVAVETQDIPPFFDEHSTNNPEQIQANMGDFEALLAHNRAARVVLAHAGRDTTGDMTASLMEELLVANSNLYLQIHPVHGPLQSPTSIVDEEGDIRPEWLTLLQDHSDRFVMGSDHFLTGGDDDDKAFFRIQHFLRELPEAVAYEIGCENPVAIYKLSSGCE